MKMSDKSKRILIIGGSGFLSGALVQCALQQGYEVWAVTRGKNTLNENVHSIIADRKDEKAFRDALQKQNVMWDAAFDCICFDPEDAQQDIEVLPSMCKHLIMVSTDFVYDPAHICFPQNEESDFYETEGYGGNKRRCEMILQQAHIGTDMAWTVIRTGHIYGPGSKLGCIPKHGRDNDLIEKMLREETIELVGAGNLLQHPTYVKDLAELMLSCIGNSHARNQIFISGGPRAIQAKEYYKIIADILGVKLNIKEIPIEAYKQEHPEHRPFLCNRVYNLEKLKNAGLKAPTTPIEIGLKNHIDYLMNEK